MAREWLMGANRSSQPTSHNKRINKGNMVRVHSDICRSLHKGAFFFFFFGLSEVTAVTVRSTASFDNRETIGTMAGE